MPRVAACVTNSLLAIMGGSPGPPLCLNYGGSEAQPSSLANHIHRMVKDGDNLLENKGSSSFLFCLFFCCLLSFFCGRWGWWLGCLERLQSITQLQI